jgi:hypothetical protein
MVPATASAVLLLLGWQSSLANAGPNSLRRESNLEGLLDDVTLLGAPERWLPYTYTRCYNTVLGEVSGDLNCEEGFKCVQIGDSSNW